MASSVVPAGFLSKATLTDDLVEEAERGADEVGAIVGPEEASGGPAPGVRRVEFSSGAPPSR